jgi:hypothetical protein
MSDFDAQLPVRALASEFTTEVANASGTTINPAEDYAQGSTTSGQNGVLSQTATTTGVPTYGTGTTNPLSTDVSGNLRVTLAGSSLTAVNVTQWDTTALGAPTAYGTPPSGNVIGVNSYVTNTVADNLTQVGGAGITLGQKTSAASIPVVIASDQSAVPVTFSTPTGVLTYFTDAAVASGATVTHSVAGPITLDKVSASGSGEIKLTVAIGVTSSEVTLWNSFTSASNQNTEMDMEGHPYTIPGGSSVKVTIKNRDTAAQDVYLTVFTH